MFARFPRLTSVPRFRTSRTTARFHPVLSTIFRSLACDVSRHPKRLGRMRSRVTGQRTIKARRLTGPHLTRPRDERADSKQPPAAAGEPHSVSRIRKAALAATIQAARIRSDESDRPAKRPVPVFLLLQ